MSTIFELQTPFENVTTVTSKEGDFFRPAATGPTKDLSELALKLYMEKYEIEASAEVPYGFISSAAHTSSEQAVEGAHTEAVERISLAAWWALDRHAIDATETLNDILTQYPTPELFTTVSGFVPSIDQDHSVAFTIIENDSMYPMAVLGGGSSKNPEDAVRKSFFEAIQSWTASVWLREHAKGAPMWDIGELYRRRLATRDNQTSLFQQQRSVPLTTIVKPYGDAFVAWSFGERATDGRSLDLAKFAIQQDEQLTVYSEHNQ